MEVIELKINDEDYSGWDAIALVENPAIELDFQAFKKQQFETYNDYPKAAVDAAKQGIKRNKEIGNKCATLVGKQRAQQLANGENLSIKTIKRMRSFLIRQKDNYDLAVKRKDYDACGYISYLLWGGPAALPWAEKKLRQAGIELTEEMMDTEITDIIGEEFIMHTLLDEGLLQHNTLDIDNTTQKHNKFTQELQDKQMIMAPIMRADYLIPRYDGEKEYMVYFSADTIKQIAYKAMKQQKVHNVNLEHEQDNVVDDVFMVETWLVEDPETDKSTLYGYEPNKGDWYGIYKIENKDIWDNYIKGGKVNGVSIEGYFTEKLINNA